MILNNCINCGGGLKGKRRKFCCDNCQRRNWDKQNPEYYRQYYYRNRNKIKLYYQERRIEYNEKRRNYYHAKQEIKLST